MRRYLYDADGGSGAEYAILLAILGAAVAGAAFMFSGAVSGSMNNASSAIASASTPTTPADPGGAAVPGNNGNGNGNNGNGNNGNGNGAGNGGVGNGNGNGNNKH